MNTDTVPRRTGRKRTYPFHTMEVNQYFFLPGKTSDFTSYVSKQSKRLGRRFVTRTKWMRETEDGGWVECAPGEGEQGVAVYREA